MPTLDTLKTFLQVAQARSFSTAARESQLARGVVSKRIAQLEAYVGQPVFSRSTRRVDLTPAGEILVDALQRALHDIDLGVEAARELRVAPSGVLRVTAPVSWGQRTLVPMLPRFLARYPQVEVELVLTDNLVDIAAQRFDIAFRMTTEHAGDMVVLPIATLERRLFASRAYLRRCGRPRSPEQLAGHTVMTYWSPTFQETVRLHDGQRTVTVASQSRLRANSPEAVLEAARAGMCIGALPNFVTEASDGTTGLEAVLPQWWIESRLGRQVHAIGLPERIRLGRTGALLEFVRGELAASHRMGRQVSAPAPVRT